MMSETNRAAPVRRGVATRITAAGVVAIYALVLLGGALFWQNEGVRSIIRGPVWFSAAAFAAIFCLIAWRTLNTLDRAVWMFFGLASMLASLTQFASLTLRGDERSNAITILWLGAYSLLLAALIAAVRTSERGRGTELALDTALVLTAGALVVVRWAPGAHVAVTADSVLAAALVVALPVFALAATLLVAVLLTAPQKTLPRSALLGTAAAVACLLISAIPQILDAGVCCNDEAWPVFASIGTWVFIAFAAASAFSDGERPLSLSPREHLRQIVAPTVAIVLSTVSVEAALNPPLGRRTAFVLGILGALVAIRLTELLVATRMQVVERRELAQSRALVEVSRALAGKNDLDDTLRTVTHWAVRVLNARAAVVELLSADGKTLVLRAAEGLSDDAIGMTFAVESSFTGRVIINGQPRVTTNPRRDPFIGEDSIKLLGDSPVAAMPLRYRDRMLGVLSCIGNRPFDAADLELLRAFANQTALALEDARLFEQVRALSITDPLTGLANRRQMDRELAREFAAAQRGRRLIVVMFDVDDFKILNDKYGHITGDEVLKRFGEALSLTTRTMNLAARYGGDEFLAILADSEVPGAEIFISRVKERFKRSMEDAGLPMVNVSAGLAEYTPEMKKPEDLIEAADRALYIEKLEADVNA